MKRIQSENENQPLQLKFGFQKQSQRHAFNGADVSLNHLDISRLIRN